MKRRRRKSYDKAVKKLSIGLCMAAAVLAVGSAAFRVTKVPVEPDDTGTTATEPGVVSSQPDETTVSEKQTPSEDQPVGGSPEVKLPDMSSFPVNALPLEGFGDADENEDSEQTMAIQTVAVPNGYVRAVGGAVTKPYSMSSLVYSRTMEDWRVHSGVDMSAEKGETVRSAAEGTVTGVQKDAMYGTVVTVNQIDGLLVKYCGLNEKTSVKVGDKVSAGTTLGTVGDIPCEIGDGSHIHIEVMKENKYLSPADMLGYR